MPKTKQEKDAIRSATEARRQQGKDRKAHHAGRGKKVQTLSDLSREMPTEDQLIVFDTILAQESSDRSAAIMAAGLVETALSVAIRSRLADPGDVITNAWFEGTNAPFSTFAAKITLGRALAIYADKMEARLIVIKNVRNTFAHRSTPLDFKHPVLSAEVVKLKTRESHNPDRHTYCAACLAISRLLIKDAFEKGGKELTISFP